ncbi:MAG: hypothetical protein JWN12_794 [Candidatus Saccharibacteria bacterium]|nr:hypothetical protein [Candidatus Saccharibacteria bacterium]
MYTRMADLEGSAVAEVFRPGDGSVGPEGVLRVEALAVGHERVARDFDLQTGCGEVLLDSLTIDVKLFLGARAVLECDRRGTAFRRVRHGAFSFRTRPAADAPGLLIPTEGLVPRDQRSAHPSRRGRDGNSGSARLPELSEGSPE